MCGRYASSRRDAEIMRDMGVASVVGEPPGPSWNVAPTQDARVVLERHVGEPPAGPPDRQLRTLRWGLVPSWAKDASIGSRLINARRETVTSKPAFAKAASRRRCLVPADGYYEWELRADRARKVPMFLHATSPLAFAGLYEFWPDPGLAADDPDRWLTTYTVLTTRAPDALGHVHDRSPVIVPAAHWDDWLDPSLTDLDEVAGLLESMPEPRLDVTEVSDAVNNHRHDGPELIEPV